MDNSLIGAILDMNIPYMFAYCVTCGTPVALLAALGGDGHDRSPGVAAVLAARLRSAARLEAEAEEVIAAIEPATVDDPEEVIIRLREVKSTIRVKGQPDIPIPPSVERPSVAWLRDYMDDLDDEEAMALILMVA